jgi:hypothetical protein
MASIDEVIALAVRGQGGGNSFVLVRLTVTVLFALIGIVELSVAVLGALLACVLGEPAIVAVDRLVSGRAALEVLGTGGDDGQEGSESSEDEDVHS